MPNYGLHVLNELCRVGADFVTIEDMEVSKAINGLAGEPRERNRNELFAEAPGKQTPPGGDPDGRDQRYMLLLGMQ